MPAPHPIRGLYVLADTAALGADLLRLSRAALLGGARVLQYRDKSTSAPRRLAQAGALKDLCREFGACFMVNDDVELARAVQADGVHLGAGDTHPAIARARLGAERLVGVSCYNRPELARKALADGADHVAFGRMYPSRTKPGEIYASLDLIQAMRAELAIPIVAIGGIIAEGAAPIIKAGAHALAVTEGVFGQPDPQAAARRLASLFSLE